MSSLLTSRLKHSKGNFITGGSLLEIKGLHSIISVNEKEMLLVLTLNAELYAANTAFCH